MSKLPPPATGVELYLAAIHEVLCDIRTALVDGGQEQEHLVQVNGRVLPASMLAPTSFDPAVPEPDEAPADSATKRTRTRNRTAEGVS